MEFVWVFVSCLLIGCALLLVCAAASNTCDTGVVDEPDKCSKGCGKYKKTFPSMKKGSKFVIDGRTAEKISDTMYQYTDTLEHLYWMDRDIQYYHMIFEPTHAYESVDSGSKTESYNTTENTYVAPIVVPVPHPMSYSNPAPAIETPPAPVHTPSYSAPSHSHSSHDSSSHSSHDSGSSHSSCSSSSSHSSCSSSSSSCSSSSLG